MSVLQTLTHLLPGSLEKATCIFYVCVWSFQLKGRILSAVSISNAFTRVFYMIGAKSVSLHNDESRYSTCMTVIGTGIETMLLVNLNPSAQRCVFYS